MAKLVALIATLSLLSLFAVAYSHHENLSIGGQVYCDTCLRLICRDRDDIHNVTVTLDATCDAAGMYSFEVEGAHEDEVCEVFLVESPMADCNETVPGLDRARILVTDNNGITSGTRFVNAMGFLRKELAPGCAEVLKSYGLPATAHV
ncbi:hypothetical protein ACHQM5_000075 [Ranunculus cassubicifolius]